MLATLSMTVVASAQVGAYPVFENDKLGPAEFEQRRQKLKEKLGEGSLAVVFTNPERNRNNDVDFLFRPDSNFLYLTGFEEPDAALIIAPSGFLLGDKRVTEVLFQNLPNQQSETWLGYRMGPDNAVKLLGIEAARPNSEFLNVLRLAAESSKAGKVAVSMPPEVSGGTLSRMVQTFQSWMQNSAFKQDPTFARTLNDMRAVKSPGEIAMLGKVCEMSALAHVEVLRSVKPGMREWELGAIVQYVFFKQGCEYTGYPPIVGSGPNSTILHYEANRRQMKAGDVVCMDTAGEFHGYSADVTRSFPVSGRFTAEQRAIYDIVLRAQDAGIALCTPKTTLGEISRAVSRQLAAGLIKLEIIKDESELGKYYMHGFGHGIGLDVHDPLPNTLVAGAVLTVEPGIYIKAGSPCDKKWWNIGIRIEDDILVTDNGSVNLSASAPRRAVDIENLMAEPGISDYRIKPWNGKK